MTVVFIDLGNTKIELLEPLGEDSPIAAFLEKNPAGGMHHVCYEVDDIIAARDRSEGSGRARAGRRQSRRSARMESRCCSCIPRIFWERLWKLEQVMSMCSPRSMRIWD